MFNSSLNILLSLLPFHWRQPKHFAWIKIIVGGLQGLRDMIISRRIANLRVLQFNAGRIYLQHKLNDVFDPTNRQILVVNNVPANPEHLFNRIELVDRFAYNAAAPDSVYVNNAIEVFASSGFTVIIPQSLLLSDILKLKVSRVLDIYNMATTNYSIVQQ